MESENNYVFVVEPTTHDAQNVVYEHMRVVKLTPQIVHESKFAEDIFRVAVCLTR
jgi:hypothetical protein